MALRPRPTVSPSSTSATRTKSTITSAVKSSPITAAAPMAMVMDSSIVMRRSRRASRASRQIWPTADQQPGHRQHVEA